MNWALILALSGGLLATVGDIFSKKWVMTDKTLFFIIGFTIYSLAVIFLIFSFKHDHIVVNTIIYILSNILTYTIISTVFFKDPLRATQLIGIGIALVAITILEMF